MTAARRGLFLAQCTLLQLAGLGLLAGRDPAAANKSPSARPIPSWVQPADLTLHVRSFGGQDLHGAELCADLGLGGNAVRVACGTSDASGRVQLRIVPGHYTLTLRHQRYRTRRLRRWVDIGRNRLTLTLSQRGHRIEGRVLDPSGSPLAGATVGVQFVGAPGAAEQVYSGRDGRFAITGLGRGDYRVRVQAAGYVSWLRSDVSVPLHGPLTVRPERRGRLRGVLTGQGRAGARVLLSLSGRRVGSRRTDAAGAFEFSDLAPGQYELAAHSTTEPWSAVDETSIGVHADHELALQLRPGARIFGHVRQLPDGARGSSAVPIAAATVVLRPESSSLLKLTAKTDEAGWFEFPPVRPGQYRLQAWAPGRLPIGGVGVRAPLRQPVALSLAQGVTLVGQVVDERGAGVSAAIIRAIATAALPRAGAHGPLGELGVFPGPVPAIPEVGPRVSPAAASSSGLWSATSDRTGRFSLSGLPSSGFGLLLSHTDFSSRSVDRVALTAGGGGGRLGARAPKCRATRGRATRSGARGYTVCQAAPTEAPRTFSIGKVALSALGRVLVRVRDRRGFALSGIRLTLALDGVSRRTQTDERGEASISSPRFGLATVVAQANGLQSQRASVSVTPSQGPALELVMIESAGQLSGTVVDAQGKALSGVELGIVGQLPEASTRSARDGSFVLRGLGAGLSKIRAQLPGYAPLERPARPGEVLRLALRRLGVAHGHVHDWRTGAAVEAFRLRVDDRQVRLVRSPEGLFRVSAPPGPHRLRVEAEGYVMAEAEVTIPAAVAAETTSAVRLQLRRAGRLVGRLLDERGEPLAAATIGCAGLRTRTGPNGAFELSGIPVGSQELLIEAPSGRRQSRPVVVHGDGPNTALVLQLAQSE